MKKFRFLSLFGIVCAGLMILLFAGPAAAVNPPVQPGAINATLRSGTVLLANDTTVPLSPTLKQVIIPVRRVMTTTSVTSVATTTVPPSATPAGIAIQRVSVVPVASLQPVQLQTAGVQPDSTGSAGAGGEGAGGPVPAGTLQTMGTGGEGQSPPAAVTHIAFIDSFIGSLFGNFFGHEEPKPLNAPSPPGSMIPGKVTIVPGPFLTLDSYRVAPVIDRGATIYIGEGQLNVTHALNQARGTLSAGGDNGMPTLTRIGWWTSAGIVSTTAPTKIVDLGPSARYKSLTVDPSDFVGYAGTWYLLDTTGNKPYSQGASVFVVRDPVLHLSVTNSANGADAGGTAVARGSQLAFSITKNIGVKTGTGVLRSPVTNSADDGFMDIVVTTPGGSTLQQLDVMLGGTPGVASLQRPCWDALADSPCAPSYTWNTGATFGNGTAKYPPGTYTVQVISKLNNMQNNYRQAGQLYEGRTASQKVTFTLV